VSVAYDVPGTLFGTVRGGDLPTALITYIDYDDGTGTVCSNDVDPAARGEVQAATALFVTAGNVIVNIANIISDNGDNDGFADTSEEATLAISVINKTGISLTNVTARLASNDPDVDCILDSFAAIGAIAEDGEAFTTATGDNFRFRVSDLADRFALGLDDLDDLSAEFSVVISADQFDTAVFPQKILIDLDLASLGGGVPDGGYFESFEVASGLGSFTTQNLDAGQQTGDPFANSQGFRCQYSDPDWVNSNSYGQITDCHVGPTGDVANTDKYWWRVHQTTDIDGGRAFSGTRSLYMGEFGAAADEHTTPVGNLEAVRMDNPVNLSGTDAAILSLTHQVSFMDTRIVNARNGRTADRGAVQIQLADGAGLPVGDWVKLAPYNNAYDQQAEDNYTNCLFDPIDDGHTEDDYDDPSDPDRRLGPSTLCYPEAIFGHIGNTFDAFNGDLGRAADGPGLAGSVGLGTWVQSDFNLQRYKGRRVRLRFVNSARKLGSNVTYEQLFENNPDPGDDGWWIDDVSIPQTLTSPVTLSIDNDPPPATPACDSEQFACDSGMLSPVLEVLDPDPFSGTLGSPGLAVELSAQNTSGNSCPDVVLQDKFSSDNDGLIRDWTDNAGLVVAPFTTTTYTVEARCSSDIACNASLSSTIFVDCPKSGTLLTGPFGQEVTAAKSGGDVVFNWSVSGDVDVVGGPLGSYPTATIFKSQLGTNTITVTPDAGTSTYFVIRDKGAFCNNGGSWNTGQASQVGDRDAVLP
jgi:hypothetical protein